MFKDSTFIGSPMLEILLQIEIKLNWLPMAPFLVYRPIFHDVTLPRQRKNWSIMAVQGAIAGDHFYYKSYRNIVLQIE